MTAGWNQSSARALHTSIANPDPVLSCPFHAACRGAWPGSYRHEAPKPSCVLGTDAAIDNLEHLLSILGINGERQLVDNADCVLQRVHEAAHNDSRVQVALQEGLRYV